VWGAEAHRQGATRKETPLSMYLLQILEDVRRRNAAQEYYLYTQSEEGKAAEAELNRLRAECDKHEASYRALCARYDAERAAEVVP
jgi:hypothetical protein